MGQKGIILLTCSEFPEGTPDDQLLAQVFKSQGIFVQFKIWDQLSPKQIPSSAIVIVRSMWDYHKKISHLKKWLQEAKSTNLSLFNSIDCILWNLSKIYLQELEQKKIPIVPTLFLKKTDLPRFQNEVESQAWDEIVIKPEISASAFKTFRLKTKDISAHWEEICSIWKECDVLVQPFCEEIVREGEFSLLFFNDGKEHHYSHAVVKKPKSQDFRVQEDHGGTTEFYHAPPALVQYGKSVLKFVPHDWLYARIDVVNYRGHYVLGELELFEPQLFFRFHSEAAPLFVKCVLKRLEGQ
ncbi:MAG: RimK family alpha-L-glutamate ligase [Bdellovibrionales bacterium]